MISYLDSEAANNILLLKHHNHVLKSTEISELLRITTHGN